MSIAPNKRTATKRAGDKRTRLERAHALCERIGEGMSLRKAAEIEGFSHRDFLGMVATQPELQVLYSQAKEAGIDARVEALTEQSDEIIKQAKAARRNAGAIVSAFATKARVVQWNAEKLAPKKYGARLDLNHSGSIDLANALNAARKRKDGDAPG